MMRREWSPNFNAQRHPFLVRMLFIYCNVIVDWMSIIKNTRLQIIVESLTSIKNIGSLLRARLPRGLSQDATSTTSRRQARRWSPRQRHQHWLLLFTRKQRNPFPLLRVQDYRHQRLWVRHLVIVDWISIIKNTRNNCWKSHVDYK